MATGGGGAVYDVIDDIEPDYDDEVPSVADGGSVARPVTAADPGSSTPGSSCSAAADSGGTGVTSRRPEYGEDLSLLDNLNEKAIVDILQMRFHQRKIQTYIGDVLLIVNPYQDIGIYGPDWHLRYVDLPSRLQAEPHVYRVADVAYRDMRRTGHAQCILVSGESGAGKTETAKHIIDHVTYICHETVGDLHERIVKVNPLLEAFGNAVTAKNVNSSRFGKYIDMHFNDSGQIIGACISEYLLEKSRVVCQNHGETNFHIFYYLFAGMPTDKLKYYYLEDAESHRDQRLFPGMSPVNGNLECFDCFRILRGTTSLVWSNSKDEKQCALMFNKIETIFHRLGFSEDEKSLVYLSLAAILFITNIEFKLNSSSSGDGVVIEDRRPLTIAADLLLVKEADLAHDLTHNTSDIRGESLVVAKTIQQANDGRDALAKMLYARLFSWIVKKINENIQPVENLRQTVHQSIGVLDLSGFENFNENYFEQFYINIANEHLQNFFNNHVLHAEQEEYLAEGITWRYIDYENNEPLLQLFLQKPTGMLELLDEESRFPEGSDRSLLEKWINHYHNNNYFYLLPSRNQHRGSTASLNRTLCFFIKHYAGEVQYNAEGFLQKNRDRLGTNLKRCMESSNLDFIKDLFIAPLTPVGCLDRSSVIRVGSGARTLVDPSAARSNTYNRRKSINQQSTVSQYFRNSLDDLMEKMRRAKPHFIRCIKPNERKHTSVFDQQLVVNQLRCSGVLEIATIRRKGFPVRLTFPAFVAQFKCLLVGFLGKIDPTMQSCQRILQHCGFGEADFAVTKAKVFLKDHTAEMLQSFVKMAAAVILQKGIRCHLAHKHYIQLKSAAAAAAASVPVMPAAVTDLDVNPGRQENVYTSRIELEPASQTTKQLSEKSEEDVTVSHGPNEAGDNGASSGGLPGNQPIGLPEIPVELPLENAGGGEKLAADNDESSTETDSELDEDKPPWDIAQNIPRERISPTESFAGLVKALKVFTYVFIALVVWLSATVGTGCFLVLVSAIRHGNDNYTAAKSQLVAIMVFPYVVTILISFSKAVFGRVPWPTLRMFLGVLAVEVLHNFGAVLLVLRVLPCFGGLFCLGIMHSICFFPSILAVVFFRRKQHHRSAIAALVWLLDLFAMMLSVGAIAMPIIVSYFGIVKIDWATEFAKNLHAVPLNSTSLSSLTNMTQLPARSRRFVIDISDHGGSSTVHPPTANLNETPIGYSLLNDSSTDPGLDLNGLKKADTVEINLYWEMPLALILISLKWWENFVGEDRGCLKLFQAKRMLHVVRLKANLIISPVSIGVIFGSVFFIEYLHKTSGPFLSYMGLQQTSFGVDVKPTDSTDTYNYNDTNYTTTTVSPRAALNAEITSTLLTLTPGIVCITCGLICYYMSALACKLLMQRVSFCLPLCLAPPTLAICIVLQCYGKIPTMPISSTLQFEFLCDITMDHYGYYVVGAALWWLVFMWITRHIWFPEAEKIAKSEKLFVTHLYTGILFAQSMMINRRRNDTELKRTGHGNLIMKEGTPTETISTTGDSMEYAGVYVTKMMRKDGSDLPVPMIYACATMWHETCNEMIQLLKSIFRMDADQCTRRIAQKVFKIKDPDYYEFEAHVFFDDCMDFNDNDEWVCNSFVKELVRVIDEAASSVLNGERKMLPPTKIPTPYGGRLVWKLPGGNNLVIHLKDKMKIRHKKRWSQVMYMYYLLGYRLFGESADYIKDYLSEQDGIRKDEEVKPNSNKKVPTWLERAKMKQNKREHFGKSSIFDTMEKSLVKAAENTFLLALDGDVDFKPDAVRLLVDRMKKNEKTGASCGRIHPIGSGPLVWYQSFEYAVGHWFQKATEHVLGCVLCSPGCFSLFRGSALMDDNVMKKYSTKSTEAKHFLQYDQGEDRWLCTLLLQQGYRVDYSAAADALTYCPEKFDEFFNQRRRWGPSTMANIWDLLADYKNTVLINDNISQVYMVYQFLLMVSTVLGPSTIVITIASAFQEVFGLKNYLWIAYLLALAPPSFYLGICFLTKPKTQILVAEVLCTMYAGVMIIVLVGLIVNMATGYILNPSLFFLAFVTASFVLAGLIHPYEFFCLLHGVLYFICIPSGYLILMIYSLSNMHIVSWGTREVPKRKSKKQQAEDAAQQIAEPQKKKKKGLFSFFRGATENLLQEIKSTLIQIFHRPGTDDVNQAILGELKKLRSQLRKAERRLTNKSDSDESSDSETEEKKKAKMALEATPEKIEPALPPPPRPAPEPEAEMLPDIFNEDPNNPPWIRDAELGDGEIDYLDMGELQFWQQFIHKYERPLKKDKRQLEKIQQDLISLRTNASFGFWMVNGIWILLNFMLQMHVAPITLFYRANGEAVKCEPLGFVFIVFFLIVLILQVVGMIKHRWGTFLEVMMITDLESPFSRGKKKKIIKEQEHEHISLQEALRLTKQTLMLEPLPDYDNEGNDELEPDYDDDGEIPPDYGSNDGGEIPAADYDDDEEEIVHRRKHRTIVNDNISVDMSRHNRIARSTTSNGTLNLDELDPKEVRRTIRSYSATQRRLQRASLRRQRLDRANSEHFGYDNDNGDGSPPMADIVVRDFDKNLDDELLTTVLPQNLMKAWNKNTWTREYFRRIGAGADPNSTKGSLRYRGGGGDAPSIMSQSSVAGDRLPRGVRFHEQSQRPSAAAPWGAQSRHAARRQRSVDQNGMTVRPRRRHDRDPRFVHDNELERLFSQRLINMNSRT